MLKNQSMQSVNVEQLEFCSVVSKSGIECFFSAKVIDRLTKQRAKVVFDFGEDDDSPADWIDLTMAAEAYLNSRPHLKNEKSAGATISQACREGKIESTGTRNTRRIDKKSFNSWLLGKQKSYLDRLDKQGS